jgi:hypothetical protein
MGSPGGAPPRRVRCPILHSRTGDEMQDLTPSRELLQSGVDPWAGMNERPQSLEPLLVLYERTRPPVSSASLAAGYPKSPHEPPRVAPSRARKDAGQHGLKRGSRPVGLPLRGEGAGVRRAKFHPLGKLALGAKIPRVDSQPPLHLPSTHLHEASVRRRDERVGLRWVDANQDSTLPACCHGHVAADQKREPTEHLPLRKIGFSPDELAYAIGEFLVVGHGEDRTAGRQSSGPPRSSSSRVGRYGKPAPHASSADIRIEVTCAPGLAQPTPAPLRIRKTASDTMQVGG